MSRVVYQNDDEEQLSPDPGSAEEDLPADKFLKMSLCGKPEAKETPSKSPMKKKVDGEAKVQRQSRLRMTYPV